MSTMLRALALKALDQRIASSAAPPMELGASAPSAETASPGSEGSSDARKVHTERRKSVGEVDIGVAGSDSRSMSKQKSDSQ